MTGYTGVKVFCGTTSADRLALGDRVTEWIAANPTLAVVETLVRQSSDAAFHCITIVVFYRPAPTGS